MIAYKLLNPDLTTYGGCQWVIGEKKTTSGDGELCGPGWLHGYEYAEIAHFLNPIHANFKRPVLYRVEAGGRQVRDGVLKSGWTEMTLLGQVDYPIPTINQRLRFAISCAMAVYRDPSYIRWAMRWLNDTDRSSEAAVRAAEAAAEAAAVRAAWAAREAAVRSAWAAAEAAWAATEAAEAAVRSAWAVWATEDTIIVESAQFALSEATYPPWISGGDRL